MKYCSNCGYANEDDANFCIKCGHPFKKQEDWFYANGNRKIGPHTADEMQILYEKNIIFDTTYVWKEGLSDWTPFNQTALFKNLPKLDDDTSVRLPHRPHYQNQETIKPSLYQEPEVKRVDKTVNNVYEETPETFVVDESDDEDILVKDEQKGNADDWYYADGLQEIGPFTKDDMIRFYSEDILNEESLVHNGTKKEWMSLAEANILPTAKKQSQKAVIEKKKTWYYAIDQDTFGPFSQDEMMHFYQVGKIKPKMYVWNKGMKDWILFKDSELMPKVTINENRIIEDKVESKNHQAADFFRKKVIPGLQKMGSKLMEKSEPIEKREENVETDANSKGKKILDVLIALFIICLAAILSFVVFQ